MKHRWPLRTNRFGEILPPSWLRHITPWWLLDRIWRRYHICWAGIVMWKLGYEHSWSLDRSCFHPYDYCGWYDTCDSEERRDGLAIAGEVPLITVSEKKST